MSEERYTPSHKADKDKAGSAKDAFIKYFMETDKGCAFLTNMNFEILFMNSSAEDFTGKDSEDAVANSRKFLDLFSETDSYQLKSICQETETKNTVRQKSIRLQATNSDAQLYEVSIQKLKSQTEGIGFHISIYQEHTVSKHSKANDDFTKVLLKSLPIPVFYKDKTGRYLGCNPAFEQFTGTKESDLLHRTVYEVWNTEQAKKYHKKDMDLLKNPGFQTYQFQVKHADGSMREVIFNKSVFFGCNNEAEGIIGTYIDISEIKEYQAQLISTKNKLKESTKILEFLFDNTIQGVVFHDADGKINFANKAAEKILGLSQNQLKGLESIDERWQALDEDSNPLAGELHPAMISLKTGKPVFNTVMGVFNPKTKDHAWINVSSYPFFEKNNKQIIRVIATFEDITRIKKANNELKIAKQKAEDSNLLKTAFLHNLSHEIRTPMNSIMGFAKMLEKPNITSEQQKKFTEVINKNATQLLTIIEDILVISSIEKNLERIDKEEIRVNELIDKIYNEHLQDARNKHLTFHSLKQYPNREIIINTDKEKLTQILKRLIKNSIKYTDKGHIELSYLISDGELQLIVSDTGIGMSEELKNKIFLQFQQGESSLTKKYGGIGLGLAIAKAYTEMINGQLSVDSTLGKGTQIKLSIPYKQNNLSKMKNEQIKKKNTILLAEDEEENYIYIKALLRDINLRTIRAENGKEAVYLCETMPEISLILMDIRMPEMNGYTAAEIIKRKHPHITIIAQSAYSPPTGKSDAEYPFFDDFIRKPIDEIEFYEIITKYIQ